MVEYSKYFIKWDDEGMRDGRRENLPKMVEVI